MAAGLRFAWLAWVGLVLGCGETKGVSSAECRRDSDCAGGESCSSVLEMPTFCPGPPQECWQASCGPGEVCIPGRLCSPQAYCVRDCTDPMAKPCGEGYRCGSSKVCEAIRCDDPDYPGCPTGMSCDPAATPDAEPGRYRPV